MSPSLKKKHLRGRANRYAAIQRLATLRVVKWPSYHSLTHTLLVYWRMLYQAEITLNLRFLEVHIPPRTGPMRDVDFVEVCAFRVHSEFTQNSLRIHRQLIQITVV